MPWIELKEQIRTKIKPNHIGILKCQGNERRKIIHNDGQKIVVRTGVETDATKTIPYEMIKFAFELIESGKEFNSLLFRERFPREYRNGPCIYSVTGGILVELGLAERIFIGGNSCKYKKRKQL